MSVTTFLKARHGGDLFTVIALIMNAQEDLMRLTLKDAKRLAIPEVVLASFMDASQKAHPEHFSDLPSLPTR